MWSVGWVRVGWGWWDAADAPQEHPITTQIRPQEHPHNNPDGLSDEVQNAANAHFEGYTRPGSNWRPSACEADVIATRPQVLCFFRLRSNTDPGARNRGAAKSREVHFRW